MLLPQRTLIALDGIFAVCKLGYNSSIPPWAITSGFFSITGTPDELSIVCHQDAVPEGIPSEGNWRCLQVAGTIPFSVVGILASLTAPLFKAEISVFAISTFDTDYLLIKDSDFERALTVLQGTGQFKISLQR